jgi:integrase
MGTRSQGEGSVYKRESDGLWVAQHLVDTPDGKTQRKYVYGKKRKDVAEELAEALKGRGKDCCSWPGSTNVAEFLADWMDSEKESVRESTQARRELVWRLHVIVRESALPVGTHLYQLRHTCATLLLQENVHLKLVPSLLGHSTIQQTLNIYSHVLDNMLSSAADGIDKALGYPGGIASDAP